MHVWYITMDNAAQMEKIYLFCLVGKMYATLCRIQKGVEFLGEQESKYVWDTLLLLFVYS